MKRITTCGLLTAVALVLSLVEKLFPLSALIPIPGIKLGLANVVTLFALTKLGRKDAISILLIRVVLASVFMGSITSFLFSLFGGLLALIGMDLLLRKQGSWFSMCGISIAGAAMHNIGQILAAVIVLGSTYVLAYLPILLLSAIPMGLVTGLVCKTVLNHLEKIKF